MKKIVTGSLVLTVFCTHVLCTVLYNIPANPLSKHYEAKVNAYMEPLFMQRWLLFAPEPATSALKLWYRVKKGTSWGHWTDPIAETLEKHQHTRFTYNAKLLYVYGNIPKDLGSRYIMLMQDSTCAATDSACKAKKTLELQASPEYRNATRYVVNDYRKHAASAALPDSVQFLIIELYPKQFSERLSSKPFGFANSTEFDPIPFPHETGSKH